MNMRLRVSAAVLPALHLAAAVVAAAMLITLVPSQRASAYTLKTLHSFCEQTNCADGSEPHGRLVKDNAGNLYGTTEFGGTGVNCTDSGGCGTVYELVFDGTKFTYKLLYSFCSLPTCAD